MALRVGSTWTKTRFCGWTGRAALLVRTLPAMAIAFPARGVAAARQHTCSQAEPQPLAYRGLQLRLVEVLHVAVVVPHAPQRRILGC